MTVTGVLLACLVDEGVERGWGEPAAQPASNGGRRPECTVAEAEDLLKLDAAVGRLLTELDAELGLRVIDEGFGAHRLARLAAADGNRGGGRGLVRKSE